MSDFKKVTIGDMIFNYDDSEYPVDNYGQSTHIKIVNIDNQCAEYLGWLADKQELTAIIFDDLDFYKFGLFSATITWINPIEAELWVYWDAIINIK